MVNVTPSWYRFLRDAPPTTTAPAMKLVLTDYVATLATVARMRLAMSRTTDLFVPAKKVTRVILT